MKTKIKPKYHKDIHGPHEDDEDHDDHVQMNEIDHYDKGEHDDMGMNYYDSDMHHHVHRSRHPKEPPGPNVHPQRTQDYDEHTSGGDDKRRGIRQKLAVVMIGKKMGKRRGRAR